MQTLTCGITPLYRIESCPKPTIARIHGVALGGGVGLRVRLRPGGGQRART